MNNIYTNVITELAETVGLKDCVNISRLLNRCGFDRCGFLRRLSLNGFGIKGRIDISKFTKHLSALDIRNNPELTGLTIDGSSPLADAIRTGVDLYDFEIIQTNEGHMVFLSESESNRHKPPFIECCETSCNIEKQPETYSNIDTINGCIKDISIFELKTDLAAIKEELRMENDMLRSALVGKYLTHRIQDNLDRTEIGFMNKGLVQLKALAKRFESRELVKKLTRQTRDELKGETDDGKIRLLCRNKADEFWHENIEGKQLVSQLISNINDMKINAKNFGKDGAKLIKKTLDDNPEKFIEAYHVTRDSYILDTACGTLRPSIKTYTELEQDY
ncbi:MAG: hypothetical protein K6B74_13875, partial [Ruminococcus sp.]|nr:hypothetical protein [Ruminococcus sp.]